MPLTTLNSQVTFMEQLTRRQRQGSNQLGTTQLYKIFIETLTTLPIKNSKNCYENQKNNLKYLHWTQFSNPHSFPFNAIDIANAMNLASIINNMDCIIIEDPLKPQSLGIYLSLPLNFITSRHCISDFKLNVIIKFRIGNHLTDQSLQIKALLPWLSTTELYQCTLLFVLCCYVLSMSQLANNIYFCFTI